MSANCPLCGRPNHCAINQGHSIESCWCAKREIPAALLEQLPPEQRMKSCICQHCIDEFLKQYQ